MSIKCDACGHALEDWWTFSATMPAETRELVEATEKALRKDGVVLNRSRRVARGQVVEMLCAEFWAGRHPDGPVGSSDAPHGL